MMSKQAELKQYAYQSNLKSRALSVLIYLIDRSNKNLSCFPAISTIAEQLHISVSTVKRALNELVKEGFIKKDARFREKSMGQTSNLYTIVQPEHIVPSVPEKSKKDTNIKRENSNSNQVNISSTEKLVEFHKQQSCEKRYRSSVDSYFSCWTGEGVNLWPP